MSASLFTFRKRMASVFTSAESVSWVLVILALVIAALQGRQIILQRRDDREKDLLIATANRDAGQAIKDAEKAREGAAVADAKAAEAHKKAAEANAEAEKAKAEAASANERASIAEKKAAEANLAASNANERAAALEVDAWAAKLELAKIQARMAPRIISVLDAAKLAAFLSAKPKGKIAIHFLASDNETARYAIRLKRVLIDAGYEIPNDDDYFRPLSAVSSPIADTKMIVQDGNDPVAVGLQLGLKEIGIDADGIVFPKNEFSIVLRLGPKTR